ncbi:MAG: RNA polymerase sigma-54 factor [Armatimonadota bacterium]
MRLAQQATQRTAQTQRISPRLVAAGAILRMASDELQSRLEEELSLNPALEAVWENTCPTCGRGMSNGSCWNCQREAAAGDPMTRPADEMPLPPFPSARQDDDDRFDPIENAEAPVSLREYVLLQARVAVPERDVPVAEYLVDALNDDGLLDASVDEVAVALSAPAPQVERVLSRLQELDPPGVFARSVQESALIQLRQLAREGPVPPLADAMISRHWRDLANHAYEKIARSLSASTDEVEHTLGFIRDNLHPYPGRLYCAVPGNGHERGPGPVRPDVIVKRSGPDYEVDVVRPFDYELRVSEAYRRLCSRAKSAGRDSPEYQLAIEHYRRAIWLLQSLALREQTLREIAQFVVEHQRSFLDTESEEKMRPLTRTQVAKAIGKHVSTISRATSGKYMLLPTGRLVRFERFFSGSVGPKTVVAELLERESPDRPLTDEQICRILKVRGFTIARRTVAKYRLALKLPSSVQRGRH